MFEPWTKEQAELYSWRWRHKISLAVITFGDHVDFYVNYAVGTNWPSWSVRMWVFEEKLNVRQRD